MSRVVDPSAAPEPAKDAKFPGQGAMWLAGLLPWGLMALIYAWGLPIWPALTWAAVYVGGKALAMAPPLGRPRDYQPLSSGRVAIFLGAIFALSALILVVTDVHPESVSAICGRELYQWSAFSLRQWASLRAQGNARAEALSSALILVSLVSLVLPLWLYAARGLKLSPVFKRRLPENLRRQLIGVWWVGVAFLLAQAVYINGVGNSRSDAAVPLQYLTDLNRNPIALLIWSLMFLIQALTLVALDASLKTLTAEPRRNIHS